MPDTNWRQRIIKTFAPGCCLGPNSVRSQSPSGRHKPSYHLYNIVSLLELINVTFCRPATGDEPGRSRRRAAREKKTKQTHLSLVNRYPRDCPGHFAICDVEKRDETTRILRDTLIRAADLIYVRASVDKPRSKYTITDNGPSYFLSTTVKIGMWYIINKY